MNDSFIIDRILSSLRETGNIQAAEDLLDGVRHLMPTRAERALEYNKELLTYTESCMRGESNVSSLSKLYSLRKKALLVAAPYCFDSYMQYIEYDRPPERRFYLSRRRVLKRIVDELQKLADGDLDELFISMPPRTGKLLADSTPILTTKGWKSHGELVVGDYVFNPNGRAVKVIAVLPKHHTTHTVTMTDDSQFKCHYRHEWKVFDRRFGKERILETKEMIGKLDNSKTQKVGKRNFRYHFQLPLKEPLIGHHEKLPVDPYTLGAWLGDGSNMQPRIHNCVEDYAIIEAIERNGFQIENTYTHSTTGVKTYSFKGLRSSLRSVGLCHSKKRIDKHIPDIYLTSSLEQRLELFAGLIDTDGCLIKKEKRYKISTSDESLRDDIVSLVSTFGWRNSIKFYEPTVSTSGIVGKKGHWTISFNPTIVIPCRLARKQLFSFSKQRRIAIKSIEESEPEQGNCITVEGGMYLAGKSLTPTHNTTLLMFFATWLIGRESEASNLYSAYSDTITSAFYEGVLEIINDPATYLWHDVFPGARIASTNAKNSTLNIDRKKRYPSLTCRSLYGTLNGACDCDSMMLSDDLISGIEEALSKDRLISAWTKVDNNLLPRAKETAKLLWCGTRWAEIDPIGMRIDLIENDDSFVGWRWKYINIPALDENDESNFDYPHKLGFSTAFYHKRRASFERNNDMASWLAQYCGEPIERSGALFTPECFTTFNGVLPTETPDRIFMAVDPSWGGGDHVAAPIFAESDNRNYMIDVIYSDADKTITRPLIVAAIKKYGIQAAHFEANKMTEDYKDWIDEELRKDNYRLNITSSPAPNDKAKQIRIFDRAPEIREFIILENGKRSKEYQAFMQNVFAFKIKGRNKSDDAPDSLSIATEMVRGVPGNPVTVLQRPHGM